MARKGQKRVSVKRPRPAGRRDLVHRSDAGSYTKRTDDAPVFPGCIVPSRLIGVIEAEQTEDGKTERNDRLLAVAANSAAHRSIRTLSDLSQDLVEQIEHFFVSYNEMKGKQFEVKGRAGRQRARALVTAAMKKQRGR